MRAEELVEYYPRLYHMAWEGSWQGIREHGLLSTRALLELYKVGESVADRLVYRHRPHWFEITREGFPRAVIRDQKPMSDNGLRRALGGTATLRDWYGLLNSMVFFWPTKKRLKTMMSAGAYEGLRHDLIVVDTGKLVEQKADSIRLSPMNSGATRPFPHPRNLDIFMSIADYPFEEKLRRYRLEGAIAEVCVLDGIEQIEACATRVATVTVEEIGAVV